MSQTDFDVIVLGAGAAGLAAAVELAEKGLKTLILEARDRIGGRICTLHDPAWPIPIELGAEFVHGRPIETWRILNSSRSGAVAYDVPDSHWFQRGHRMGKMQDFWQAIERIFQKVDRHRGADLSFADFLKAHARLDPEHKRLVCAYVEGFDAADTTNAGVEWLKLANRAEDKIGDELFRVSGGYDRVIRALLMRLGDSASIRLNDPAVKIHWSKTGVTLLTRRGGEFRARAAIVTLPLGVLQAMPDSPGAVQFVPELAEKKMAMRNLRMGAVTKVLLRFDEPFWESRVDRGVHFMHSSSTVFPTWWTAMPMRAPVLTGWCGGPVAWQLSRRTQSSIAEQTIDVVGSMMGIRPSQVQARLRGWHVSDWQNDPYSRGAYSYGGVGGAGAPEELSRPIAKTLYFAGEAAHPGMSGTVAGAIASGQRAARMLVSAHAPPAGSGHRSARRRR